MKRLLLNTNETVLLQQLHQQLAPENPLYLVGGYIRNRLFGLPPSDLDVASANLPAKIIEQAQKANIAAKMINEKLGTVELHIGGQKIEHTSFRKESYGPGGGHTPREVKIGVSMEEDALRRDFSINALYYDFMQGVLLDPTKRGLVDIQKKHLRSTTTDPVIIIKDDALRLLRMVRFAAQMNLTIESELFAAAKKYVHQMHDVAKERIIMELDKILLADEAYPMLTGNMPAQKRGLLFMGGLGLLEVLVPEFEGYRGFGKSAYHKNNLFLHTVNTVSCIRAERTLRYAALLHDVGKPICYKETGKMLGHDAVGAEIAKHRLPLLGADKKLTKQVAELVQYHMYDLNGKAKENKVRLMAQQLGYTQFLRLADLREADVLGSGMETGTVYTAEKFRDIAKEMQEENTPMTVQELALNGTDLQNALGIQGELIGETLVALLKHCAIAPAQNTKHRLLYFAKGYIKNKAQ